MISRWLEKLPVLFAYFCVATIMAQVIGLAFLRLDGRMDSTMWVRLLAALHGVDLAEVETDGALVTVAVEEPGLDEIAEARAVKFNNLVLRERALVVANARYELDQRSLADRMRRFQLAQESFERELGDLRDASLDRGQEESRLVIESLRPDQAKQQILLMLELDEMNEVVLLFSGMPDSKRKKITAEFKTEDEAKTLHEILTQLRRGVPEVGLIDRTRSGLDAARNQLP